MSNPLLVASGAALALACGGARAAESAPGTISDVIVTAPSAIANLSEVPNTTSTVTAEQIARTINLVTPEDALRYLPNVLIRQRHLGDTQSPVTTRTSGVGASARSLIYVDGMLISSLIGNNNTSASPKWGLVSPAAIDRVDVLNGPFAAAFAGNSIGSVITFTTRTPEGFEAHLEGQAAIQAFRKYGGDARYRTGRIAADVAHRWGDLTFRLSYNHLDSRSQPLTYATVAIPSAFGAAVAPTTGGFSDANRVGQAILVLGSTGLEHQAQENASGRLTYDLTPTLTLAYSFGLFLNRDDATANSDLRNTAGQPVYAGPLNIGGRSYNLAASVFSNGVYRFDEAQLAQGLSLSSHTQGRFDFDLTATTFDYLKSRQRVPGAALPGAFSAGPGTLAVLDNTGWTTLDANGKWRPGAAQTVTFGLHQDSFTLDNPRFALAAWTDGPAGALTADSQGRTRTQALWAQDVWAISPQWKLTVGGRYERWRAYQGRNFSAAPPLDVRQPNVSHSAFSPKAVLAWSPSPGWTLKASAAIANRFPTVTELYQAITTGVFLSVPNPNLRPERALSAELSAERRWSGGNARVALFDERLRDTLLSQTARLAPGSEVLFTYVQNVDRTHATGIEFVADQQDVLVPGLELSGWLTYLATRVDEDRAFQAAVGKRLPQLPRWRGALVATYSATPKLDLTLAVRYSDRAFGMLDNSDHYANTYQGFGAFLVADAHAQYRLNEHVTAGLGVNNLNNRAYFVFHPFPQRTLIADLKYSY